MLAAPVSWRVSWRALLIDRFVRARAAAIDAETADASSLKLAIDIWDNVWRLRLEGSKAWSGGKLRVACTHDRAGPSRSERALDHVMSAAWGHAGAPQCIRVSLLWRCNHVRRLTVCARCRQNHWAPAATRRPALKPVALRALSARHCVSVAAATRVCRGGPCGAPPAMRPEPWSGAGCARLVCRVRTDRRPPFVWPSRAGHARRRAKQVCRIRMDQRPPRTWPAKAGPDATHAGLGLGKTGAFTMCCCSASTCARCAGGSDAICSAVSCITCCSSAARARDAPQPERL